MTLKVIGAGFGRTGTLSLKSALETLDFVKTHHMEEVLLSGKQVALWHDIAMGKPADWDAVFEGYQASVDFPSCGFYKELMTRYPDAKVVLTVRDADSWYRSAANTIYVGGRSVPRWVRMLVPRIRRTLEMVDAIVWKGVFQDRFEDEAFAKQIFLDHNEAVKVHVPAEKLLVYQVKEGWGPLCAFLDCPVPDVDFPNVNDTAEFRRRIKLMKLAAWSPLTLLVIVLLALLLDL